MEGKVAHSLQREPILARRLTLKRVSYFIYAIQASRCFEEEKEVQKIIAVAESLTFENISPESV